MINFSSKPKEHWDNMKDKEALKAAFTVKDVTQEVKLARFLQDAEKLPIYYKDDEFKDVAQRLKKAAEPLRAVLLDIARHLPDRAGMRVIKSASGGCNYIAKEMINDIGTKEPDGLAIVVWFVLQALDGNADGSIVKYMETGGGIPEARAVFRAYNRFKVIQQKEAERLEAFKQTAEYKKQLMEIKLGLREEIEYPAE